MNHRDSDPIDAEIREIFAQTDAGPHPSSDELTAYAWDELAEHESGRIRRHLGLCRECTAAVLALEFSHLQTPSDQPSDAEVVAGTEAIMASIQASEQPEDNPVVAPTASDERPRQRVRSQRTRWLLAAAAVLAIACLSLALLTITLQHQVRDLETALAQVDETPSKVRTDPLTPHTGVPIVDLFPSSVIRGDSATAPAIPVNAEAAMIVLVLTPPSGLTPDDAHSLRVLDSANRELWRGPARLDSAGTFVLLLPRRFVRAGADRVVLYRLEDGLEQPLETFELQLEP